MQKGKSPLNECPGYDIKPSEGLRDLGNVEYPFNAIAPRFTLSWNGSTW